MNQQIAKGIILSRTDYGEADRIITILTPDNGKLRLMARGVRRSKSKLAGGIELFSISDITYISGRGEIGTLISSRLVKHYGRIVQDIGRVQLGYELIKILNKATEDNPEADYFELLNQAFEALDDKTINTELILAWFEAQLLKMGGHTPNLKTDTAGNKLDANEKYSLDTDAMTFDKHAGGSFNADHIKVLRLLFSNNSPHTLSKVQNLLSSLSGVTLLLDTMLSTYIRR